MSCLPVLLSQTKKTCVIEESSHTMLTFSDLCLQFHVIAHGCVPHLIFQFGFGFMLLSLSSIENQ